MKLTRLAIALAAPLSLQFVALPAPAYAQGPTHYERAILTGLDTSTRQMVQRRATGGNTVSGVVATTLLNNYQQMGPTTPGEAVSVVAIDFVRGTVVLRKGETLVLHRFNAATLAITP